MVSRAIHLEPAENLSTEAFLAALQRFVARRGLPHEIFSDNATGVMSVKSVLKKVYASTTFTIIEFSIILCQIEAIVNSRPLFAHSQDPSEPEVLIPEHFLIDRPLTAVPEPSYSDIPMNRLSRWQQIKLRREHFWKRWSREYMMELQTRGKWTKRQVNVQPGTIVLVREENLPPQS